jgi:hypothetical protein
MALRPELVGSAVLLDLVLTSAFCHWILGVRWGGLPVWTIVPVSAAGLTVSRIVLPAGSGDARLLPLAAVVLVESAMLLLMVTRVSTLLAGFRAARATGADRLCAIEAGLIALGPGAAPLARWVRLELALWGFCFFWWCLGTRVPARATAFGHHKDAGWSMIAGVLATLLVLEAALVHSWLSHAGYTLAMWLALVLHVYGLIWLVGDALALCVNRSLLLFGEDGAEPILELRVGVRARGRFPLSSIVEVRTGSWDTPGPDEGLVNVSGPANASISFARAVEFKPMLGAPVQIKCLLLQVDDPDKFKQTLSAALLDRESPRIW